MMHDSRRHIEEDLAGVHLMLLDLPIKVTTNQMQSFLIILRSKRHFDMPNSDVFKEGKRRTGGSEAVDVVPDLSHQFDREVVEGQAADNVLVNTLAGQLLHGGMEDAESFSMPLDC